MICNFECLFLIAHEQYSINTNFFFLISTESPKNSMNAINIKYSNFPLTRKISKC